jgi:hypothetical protein
MGFFPQFPPQKKKSFTAGQEPGEQIFDLPPVLAPNFLGRLAGMASMAESLPIASVPKQFRITLVRDDVIHIRCRFNRAQLSAINAEWMSLQKPTRRVLPAIRGVEFPRRRRVFGALRRRPRRIPLRLLFGTAGRAAGLTFDRNSLASRCSTQLTFHMTASFDDAHRQTKTAPMDDHGAVPVLLRPGAKDTVIDNDNFVAS